MLFSVAHSDPALSAALAHAFPDLEVEAISENELRVESGTPIRVGPLVRLIEDEGTAVTEARRVHPSLEDVFVRVTSIEADAMRKEKEKIEAGA